MIQAARRRLRPIVMTALAAMTGMLPLALALGSGSQMLQPLAIAVIGGLLISMASVADRHPRRLLFPRPRITLRRHFPPSVYSRLITN